ncbi:MAG: Tol-Pal system beta propeller repeat protein TolB [Pseudomonadota bacterium]|nr:Tol-Pal system beta propeller repeat protein TolB [Pseudomonadota bacterium]
MTRKTVRLAAVLLALLLPGLPAPALAELKIVIDEANPKPMPIAITDMQGSGPQESTTGKDISKVITANLERSGLFQPLNPASFIQDASASQQPRFADWRVIGTQALVTGTVKKQADGNLRVEFRLWDAVAEQQLTGLAYSTIPGNWRRIAHIISDEIYKRLTGEEGYFDTQIVYISETGPADNRVKRLAIMDQDGQNHRFLTDGRNLVLTPRFSPTAREITYLSYVNRKPRVYLFNIDVGRQELLGDFPGMTFAPRFSPDGNRVILSQASDGNTDIYTQDLRTRRKTRLTDSTGIDTAPSYAPDGKQIVFESDRGGSQQIYVMDADGGNPHRISFGEGSYGSPVWSPRGDLIAFTRIHGGQFYIGVIRPDGTGERMLANAFHVEGPTWAPNGRVLMYFSETPSGSNRQGRTARLYSVDLTGANLRQVPTPQDASDPAWSPLIP